MLGFVVWLWGNNIEKNVTQQNTQAVILQQPNGEKLQVELKITQVANDTTAMKSFEESTDISIASFDSATIIAVSLALFATGLAYWFGMRSFVLTKQGFNLTLEQIGKSVEQTLNSNKELYQSQENLKLMEIRSNHRQEWINKVRDIFIEILSEIEITKTDLCEYATIDNLDILEFQNKVEKNIFSLHSNFYSLKLYLNRSEKTTDEIFSVLEVIDKLFIGMYNDYQLNKQSFNEKIKKIDQSKMENAMRKLLKEEWEKIKKGE